jgi:pyruvate dehydrogenase E2 component (dihydrolipoamide acetyltransferase)
VDTEQGLIVPVLRDVDKKDLLTLSKEMNEIAAKTRERKISLEEMQGGTFTISNQGGIGGGHFTPIINRPETAILGPGPGRDEGRRARWKNRGAPDAAAGFVLRSSRH